MWLQQCTHLHTSTFTCRHSFCTLEDDGSRGWTAGCRFPLLPASTVSLLIQRCLQLLDHGYWLSSVWSNSKLCEIQMIVKGKSVHSGAKLSVLDILSRTSCMAIRRKLSIQWGLGKWGIGDWANGGGLMGDGKQ